MAYRPTEKTKARRAAQFESLRRSAVQIISTEGFQGLTISLVASTANVATGTVYKYFDSKADLCTQAFRFATEKEVLKVQQAAFPNTTSSCRKRLINAINVFANRAIKSGKLAYALIAEPADYSVDLERLKYRKAYADIYEKLIIEGIKSGEFPDQNAAVSAAAIVGVTSESLVVPLGLNNIKPKDQHLLIESILLFCLRAVAGETDKL